jgi:hypothetical protein
MSEKTMSPLRLTTRERRVGSRRGTAVIGLEGTTAGGLDGEKVATDVTIWACI